MSVQTLQQAAQTRRSIYALNKELPVSAQEVSQIVEHAVQHTPSDFNSQSTRVVILFGEQHDKLWEITRSELQKIIPVDRFETTAQKLDMFKAGAGTILFFEDQEVVKSLQAQFPMYAANFPVWSEHNNAMHQYAIWTTLAAAGVGANLQHYDPVIDAEVAKAWQLPVSWLLCAQMVFGGIASEAAEKEFKPLTERLRVFGL